MCRQFRTNTCIICVCVHWSRFVLWPSLLLLLVQLLFTQIYSVSFSFVNVVYLYVVFVINWCCMEPESGKSLISDFEMHWPKIRSKCVYFIFPIRRWKRSECITHIGHQMRQCPVTTTTSSTMMTKLHKYMVLKFCAFSLSYLHFYCHHIKWNCVMQPSQGRATREQQHFHNIVSISEWLVASVSLHHDKIAEKKRTEFA